MAYAPAAVSCYDAVAPHHAGKLRLRHGLRRMAEGGAAVEASDAQAACLTAHRLQQACRAARTRDGRGQLMPRRARRPWHPTRANPRADALRHQPAVLHGARGAVVVLGLEPMAGQACWWVVDAGPGLDTQQQAQLFQRHVPQGTQPGRTAGFGLGLYFVRLVAEKHGGSVGVQSAPGQGASFWMTLPLEPG
ncbi:putative Histidine kinase [Thiomonas sp. X19]|uniref:sensor histidine kinase n=1 Tax=Thiomonas sp. X19 TaxID=1050370 RepID=UPI000B623D5E|nr:sensor histidine kinase [Thiomonas sp. X19]SCC91138.1 putative Histidine kinase [Thiomonas sp. X19]